MVATDQFACEHSTVHKSGIDSACAVSTGLSCRWCSSQIYTNSTNVSTCKVLVLKIVMFPMKPVVPRAMEGKQVKRSADDVHPV